MARQTHGGLRARKAKTYPLQFRVEQELIDRLDEQAETLGVSRASYARMLLQQAMGDDTHVTVLQETMYVMTPIIYKSIAKGVERLLGQMPEVVLEVIHEWDDPAMAILKKSLEEEWEAHIEASRNYRETILQKTIEEPEG